MIHEVDETLRALIRRDALNGNDVEVVFDAPTKEWASRRNTPTLDVYLYDIREDLRRRAQGVVNMKDETGRIVGRMPPARHYKLSYLVTAWTQRPEDEHRLLSAVLGCFLRYDKIPEDMLAGSLNQMGLPILSSIALPPPEDRALSDVWSAMGGELKPSLDLVVTTPIDLGRLSDVEHWVLAPPVFTLGDGEREESTKDHKRASIEQLDVAEAATAQRTGA